MPLYYISGETYVDPRKRSVVIHGVRVFEFDEVLVTGRACSEPGKPYLRNVHGVVGAVDTDAIKLWPYAEGGASASGKLWFEFGDVDGLTVTRRNDMYDVQSKIIRELELMGE